MFIQTHSKSSKLTKNQILVLCKENEVIPEEIHLNGIVYTHYADTSISKELQAQDYVVGKTFQTNNCVIHGCDNASDFKKNVPESEIIAVASDIWNNPQKYSKYAKDSDDSYDCFLKYLDITYPDGSEKRLVDVAITK